MVRPFRYLALLAVIGCEASSGGVREAPPEARTPPASEPPPTHSTEVRAVSQPVGEPDLRVRALLSDAARATVDRAPVPALVPSDEALARAAIATAGEHWFAFSARTPDVTVSLHATRVVHHYAHVKPTEGDRELRGERGFVTRNEGIWTASWTTGGVAYSLDVECAAPTDALCADDAYLLQRVKGLVWVGGAGRVVEPEVGSEGESPGGGTR